MTKKQKVGKKNWYVTVKRNEYGGKSYFDNKTKEYTKDNKYE